MSVDAIVMIIIAVTCVWGGFILAVINLRRHPEEPDSGGVVHQGRHEDLNGQPGGS